MKHCLTLFIFLSACSLVIAQTKPADSVVIRVGQGSKVIIAIKNKEDLATLKHYDFQALVNDMITKLEAKDTTPMSKPSSEYLKDSVKKESAVVATGNEPQPEQVNTNNWNHHDRHHWRGRRTYHSFNFDLGMNNYLEEGTFPDADNALYTVKPWGSWYVGINSVQRTRLTRKFFLEWGGGISWYNFKFQNFSTHMSEDDNGVIFTEDPRELDFRKSKLTATYLNASFVPLVDFGGNRRRSMLFDGYGSDAFRIGLGGYIGYRIDSYTKVMYKESGDKRKEHDHDNFYLNNMRYGLRLQVGYDDIDLFVNYDLNELFIEGKGPKLNAFSFGITL